MGSKRALSTTHPALLELVALAAAPAVGAANTSARATTAMLPTTGPPTRSLRPIGRERVPRTRIFPPRLRSPTEAPMDWGESVMGASEGPLVDVADVGRNRQVLLMRVCGALAVVVFLAGIAGLAAVSPARSWTPAQQLARVRQFVTSARTARFTGTSTWASGSAKGQLGSHFEHTSRAAGVLSLPDRSHWTEDYGDGATETIVTADAVFERDADTVPAL